MIGAILKYSLCTLLTGWLCWRCIQKIKWRLLNPLCMICDVRYNNQSASKWWLVNVTIQHVCILLDLFILPNIQTVVQLQHQIAPTYLETQRQYFCNKSKLGDQYMPLVNDINMWMNIINMYKNVKDILEFAIVNLTNYIV